jgi:hypothetical protein
MVKVYDNTIPDELCKILIKLFEDNIKHQEYFNEDSCPCFTQVNINKISLKIVNNLIPYLADVYRRYQKDAKNYYSPPLKELEEFRIKRYNTSGNERFDEHVDVNDIGSSIRAVAFLFYLNSNNGNTIFPNHELNIKPECGRVVVFPPTWEYPHAGLPPSNNSKYILSTYIHYGKN